MGKQPYLLFDAGGTIVFPDQDFLICEAQKRGIELTHEQLYKGYYRLIYSLDYQVQNGNKHEFPCPCWPNGYAHHLFETLDILDLDTEAVAKTFWKYHLDEKNLWAFTFEWVVDTLSLLAGQGYRMSVISNSDGRTEEVIHQVGLDKYFERIFDSALLHIEKPKPEIFNVVLRELNLQPEDALYIGDIYYIDVLGANQAGLGAIHIDPLNLYDGWPGVHLKNVSELPEWLDQYTIQIQDSDSSAINQEPAPIIQTHSSTARLFQPINLNSLIPLIDAFI